MRLKLVQGSEGRRGGPNLADLQVGEMNALARASSGRRRRATVCTSALEGQNRPRACALRVERESGATPAPRAQHHRARGSARWVVG